MRRNARRITLGLAVACVTLTMTSGGCAPLLFPDQVAAQKQIDYNRATGKTQEYIIRPNPYSRYAYPSSYARPR